MTRQRLRIIFTRCLWRNYSKFLGSQGELCLFMIMDKFEKNLCARPHNLLVRNLLGITMFFFKIIIYFEHISQSISKKGIKEKEEFFFAKRSPNQKFRKLIDIRQPETNLAHSHFWFHTESFITVTVISIFKQKQIWYIHIFSFMQDVAFGR